MLNRPQYGLEIIYLILAALDTIVLVFATCKLCNINSLIALYQLYFNQVRRYYFDNSQYDFAIGGLRSAPPERP